MLIDPPLRANERILSGLFGNAIAAISERSRPEVRIDRVEDNFETLKNDTVDDSEDESGNCKLHVGRIDYLAWYANRTFAIELKSAFMNCETNIINDKLKKRWKKVVEQAAKAQTWLRKRNKEESLRYPNPLSVSIMTVIAKRVASKEKVAEFDSEISNFEDSFIKELSQLEPKPQFLALYTFPKEFRCLAPRKHGKPVDGNMIYTPFIAFVVRSNVNSKSSK
jgi:hypothetical protein